MECNGCGKHYDNPTDVFLCQISETLEVISHDLMEINEKMRDENAKSKKKPRKS